MDIVWIRIQYYEAGLTTKWYRLMWILSWSRLRRVSQTSSVIFFVIKEKKMYNSWAIRKEGAFQRYTRGTQAGSTGFLGLEGGRSVSAPFLPPPRKEGGQLKQGLRLWVKIRRKLINKTKLYHQLVHQTLCKRKNLYQIGKYLNLNRKLPTSRILQWIG